MLKQDSTLGLSFDIKLDGLSRNATLWGETISSYLLKYTLSYIVTERFSMSLSTKPARIVKGHIASPTMNKQTKRLGSIRYLNKVFSSSLSLES